MKNRRVPPQHLHHAQSRLALLLSFAVLFGWLAPTASLANRTSPATVPAQPQADSIRQISLVTNDIVYSQTDKMLYASVPSSVGAIGNSITAIDPFSGIVGQSVFVGSEPNRLALSDDSHTLYTSLDGAYAVRRFDLMTKTAGSQFSLGQDSFFGRYTANDIAVAPGNPDLVAVARYYRGTSPPEAGVAVFDNGVQRTKTGPGHIEGSDFLAFSPSASKLYGGGYSYGLRTMTIDSTGVTVNGKTTFNVGARIKYDNGLVFSSSGQVINPETGTLLGTFSGANSSAFVSDSSAGRAYYIVNTSGTVILKAFDINTFLQVGSLTIPGVVGDAVGLVRWGTNGLAFRTTGGQLFLIQTALIPTADPIPAPAPTPTPTPIPTPTPAATFVRQLSLNANDLVFDQTTQKLYASVPSAAGAGGNSITPIDPVNGSLGASVFVGSEPNRMALANDGQTLYVGLDGASAVRRFNLISQTAEMQFSLGADNFSGPYSMNDIAVAPGNPDLVAVARYYPGSSPPEAGVAAFDKGIQRPTAGPGHLSGSDYLVFSPSETTLYGMSSSKLSIMNVDASGVTVSSTVSFPASGVIRLDNGLVYSSSGHVVNPATGAMVGTFPLSGYGSFNPLMALDSANGRIFFLTANSANGISVPQLRAYDINTFLLVGIANIGGISGTPTSLVRWGANGLAFRTSNNQVFLIETALVNASQPVPTPIPTPSPTPTPSPAYIPTFVRAVNLPVNDLVFSQATQKLYASVPSSAGSIGNSITAITPETGAIGQSTFIGSEPNRLALSDDGQTLYTTLDGANAVRRFDIPSQTPGLQFVPASSFQRPSDMEVLPGNPKAVALAAGFDGVAVYDDGVQRPNASKGTAYSIDRIEFSATNEVIYGYDNQSSGFEVTKLAVGPTGVTPVYTKNNLLSGYGADIEFNGGLLYGTTGRVVDPEAASVVGTFKSNNSSAIAIDRNLGRLFSIRSGTSTATLTAYDLNTFLPLGSVTMTNVVGTPMSLVRWGANGLAFRTVSNSGYPNYNNSSQVYLVQSALVSSAASVPSGVQFSSDKYSSYETDPSTTITVTRTGDVSTPASISYATSDGTATAGNDYLATSGTLNFAPGELSKSFTVSLIDDNIYEAGSETFNVTLSDPSGGVLLTSPSTVIVALYDNEQRPDIYLQIASVVEGDSGTVNAEFTATLTGASAQTVTADFTTADGSATAGSDYIATRGSIAIPPGQTKAIIKVPVIGDIIDEPDEIFSFSLSNVVNAYNYGPTYGRIIDDDNPPPNITVTDVKVTEGDAGTTNAVFTVKLSTTSKQTVSVGYATANLTATAGSDYAAQSGTLSFNPNVTEMTIAVPVNGDTTVESNETFALNLNNADGGAITDNQGIGAITDDDRTRGDFDGDGKADLAVWQPHDGNWQIINSGDDSHTVKFWGGEENGDFLVPADYDGDGKCDIAVWRSGEGNWYVLQSATGTAVIYNWGDRTDRPVPGDYDGDGKTDIAVFRPGDGNWYVRNSATNTSSVQGWGNAGDRLAPGDYDGDGKTDFAVFRPSDGNWYIKKSAGGTLSQNWGLSGDRPVPADYDGDGKADIAVFRPSEGSWYIVQSSTGTAVIRGWGDSNDAPVACDYDGDGKADLAVYRPTEGSWYIIPSSNSAAAVVRYLGGLGDLPVPSSYFRP